MSEYTRIGVLYRDADNFKSHGYYHVAGELTPEHVNRLRATVNGDGHFLPRQIGADHLGGALGDYDEQSDHPWHEMDLDDVETTDYPDGEYMGTAEEFVATMEKASEEGWDDITYGLDDDYGWGVIDLETTPPEPRVTEQPRDIYGRYA